MGREKGLLNNIRQKTALYIFSSIQSLEGRVSAQVQ
jgi:hypothetical protein